LTPVWKAFDTSKTVSATEVANGKPVAQLPNSTHPLVALKVILVPAFIKLEPNATASANCNPANAAALAPVDLNKSMRASQIPNDMSASLRA